MNVNEKISTIYKGTQIIDSVIKNNQTIYSMLKTLSGIPPLSFKSIGKPLIQYEIYGNTEQGDTPTPTAPVEMESVGELQNLFDKNAITENRYIDANGNLQGQDTISLSDYIFLKSNEKINIGYRGSWQSVGVFDKNKTFLERIAIVDEYIPTQDVYIRINIPNEYINKLVVYEDGKKYAIPIKVQSKNLIMETLKNKNLNGVGVLENFDGFDMHIAFLEKGSTYYINSQTNVIGYYDNKPTSSSVTYNNSRTVLSSATNILTPERDGYIAIRTTSNEFIQLEKGTQATSYQPYYNETTNIYLNEPLRKMGNYTDYIDFETGKRHNSLTEIIVTENNVAYHGVYNGIYQYEVTPTKDFYEDNNSLMSSHFAVRGVGNWWTINNNLVENTNNGRVFYLTTDKYKNIDEFKEFVKNNRVSIVYRLRNQSAENIELPEILTTKGINNLIVDTKIQPSNMIIKYK